MSVQIRISYETDEELLAITERLEGLDLRLKKAPQAGAYQRAYLRGRAVFKPVATASNTTPQNLQTTSTTQQNTLDKAEQFRYTSRERMFGMDEQYPIP